MSDENASRRGSRGRWLFLVMAVVGVCVIIYVVGKATRRAGSEESLPVYAARRGPLVITVTEPGSLRNREKRIIYSEVEGRATVVSVVEEGTEVKEGDLLVELDSSEFDESRIAQEIKVENAEAALLQARENMAIAQNQAQADVEKAETALQFARLDLTKYEKGDYPLSLERAKSEITLAEQDLKQAEDKHEWSTKLEARGYITRSELVADELAVQRRRLDLKSARNELMVLEDYTHQRDLEERRSNEQQAVLALERAQRKARADVVNAETNVRARESEFQNQKNQLEKILKQIKACKIMAPVGGMAVYATTGGGRRWHSSETPLAVGSDVHERQELIHVPVTDAMNVEVRVQEANLRKLRVGQLAHVRLDAAPGEVFSGTLTKIAILPDASRSWLNPDLKVYDCTIELDGTTSRLRPGMICRAEIVIKELKDAVYVPIQAVTKIDGSEVVHVVSGEQQIEKRVVVTGRDNGRVVHVVSGLEEGETVWLAPPLEDAERPMDARGGDGRDAGKKVRADAGEKS